MSADALKRISQGGGIKSTEVNDTIDGYNDLHSKQTVEGRKKENFWMVHKFYDMVTGMLRRNSFLFSFLLDFYEWGWGASFHFAPRAQGESFKASIARHEHLIALYLNLRPGMRVADLGCGVGGPAREIAQFSGAHITVCLLK